MTNRNRPGCGFWQYGVWMVLLSSVVVVVMALWISTYWTRIEVPFSLSDGMTVVLLSAEGRLGIHYLRNLSSDDFSDTTDVDDSYDIFPSLHYISFSDTVGTTSIHFTTVLVPYWWLVAPSVLALAAFPRLKRYWRWRHNICVNCGYDLRASTSGVCPECGHHRKVSAVG